YETANNLWWSVARAEFMAAACYAGFAGVVVAGTLRENHRLCLFQTSDAAAVFSAVVQLRADGSHSRGRSPRCCAVAPGADQPVRDVPVVPADAELQRVCRACARAEVGKNTLRMHEGHQRPIVGTPFL